ncbi:hypothetical protein RO3G_07253 [Rhizopus delemar RA 99-880]|uniref:Uncharacterized protein n=1 Tax=Rhizopus delemar (strain RA 99-880 / ATCC MYA-4621 / FGSC 9543 / NRRL 43880) TaxID=246409 RepID=I1C268_RHIO9|nr:hypothetical protein RO3G_07253 [Rhizopus delemar RA 99-880]|eukprot:EIE82548.1 hypothetical protein RO3G_07253 [Rhizopus delemar RA 99-880]
MKLHNNHPIHKTVSGSSCFKGTCRWKKMTELIPPPISIEFQQVIKLPCMKRWDERLFERSWHLPAPSADDSTL